MSASHPHRHPRPAWGVGARSFLQSPRGRAVTAAALTLPGAWHAPRAVQVAWVTLPAVVVAGKVAAIMRERDDPAPTRAALTTACAAGVVSAGALSTGLWVDARLERVLRRARVPAPRLALAVTHGALSATMSHLAGRRLDALAADGRGPGVRRAAPGRGSPTDPRPRSGTSV